MTQSLLLCVMLAVFSPVGFAKSFETSYLQLELPDDWSCERVQADWACRPTDKASIHTASLIFSAKAMAAEDTFSSLVTQLKTPRTISATNGKGTITSKVNWSRTVDLAGHGWVEALHTNGEIESYLTYYLATVTPRLTVLLNFSFQQSRAKQFQPALDTIRRSVTLKKSALESVPAGAPTQPLVVQPRAPLAAPPSTAESTEHTEINRYFILIGIFGAAAALFFAARRRRG